MKSPIGTGTVLLTNLVLHKDPDFHSKELGTLDKMQEIPVYEVLQKENCTYFRTSGNQWVLALHGHSEYVSLLLDVKNVGAKAEIGFGITKISKLEKPVDNEEESNRQIDEIKKMNPDLYQE